MAQPTPWEVDLTDFGIMDAMTTYVSVDDGHEQVARVPANRDGWQDRANLVAAAPDLLAALELALPRLAHKHSCLSCRPIQEWEKFGSASFENCDCEIKIVQAAISRALPGGEGK